MMDEFIFEVAYQVAAMVTDTEIPYESKYWDLDPDHWTPEFKEALSDVRSFMSDLFEAGYSGSEIMRERLPEYMLTHYMGKF